MAVSVQTPSSAYEMRNWKIWHTGLTDRQVLTGPRFLYIFRFPASVGLDNAQLSLFLQSHLNRHAQTLPAKPSKVLLDAMRGCRPATCSEWITAEACRIRFQALSLMQSPVCIRTYAVAHVCCCARMQHKRCSNVWIPGAQALDEELHGESWKYPSLVSGESESWAQWRAQSSSYLVASSSPAASQLLLDQTFSISTAPDGRFQLRRQNMEVVIQCFSVSCVHIWLHRLHGT